MQHITWLYCIYGLVFSAHIEIIICHAVAEIDDKDYVLYNGNELSNFGLVVEIAIGSDLGRFRCPGEVAQFDYFASFICHKLGHAQAIVSE